MYKCCWSYCAISTTLWFIGDCGDTRSVSSSIWKFDSSPLPSHLQSARALQKWSFWIYKERWNQETNKKNSCLTLHLTSEILHNPKALQKIKKRSAFKVTGCRWFSESHTRSKRFKLEIPCSPCFDRFKEARTTLWCFGAFLLHTSRWRGTRVWMSLSRTGLELGNLRLHLPQLWTSLDPEQKRVAVEQTLMAWVPPSTVVQLFSHGAFEDTGMAPVEQKVCISGPCSEFDNSLNQLHPLCIPNILKNLMPP